jgi:SAM-dependent methyltransferase
VLGRAEWLKEKRRMIEIRYDTMYAYNYDDHWGHINPSHRTFLLDFLAYLPGGASLLDAACGTGKYWPFILGSKNDQTHTQEHYTLLGIDQSRQMLRQAQTKFPGVPTEKLGLQEMSYHEAFDGILCVDAMEMIFPEDWPLVLHNFHRALRNGGYCYFTVEIIDPGELIESQAEARRQGLPIVEGEYAHSGGYHYYPRLEQVRAWLQAARFTVIEEGEGDGYHHFIVQKA